MQKLQYPKANYFPVPNNICAVVGDLSGSEIKVLLYILRHTWGFPDDDRREPKRLTFDDFLRGREARSRKTGKRKRMDSGCGLTQKGTLSKALTALATKHKLILVIEDRHDGARVRKSYRSRLPEDEGFPGIVDLKEYIILRKKSNQKAKVEATIEFPEGNAEFPRVNPEFPRVNSIIQKETKEKNSGKSSFPIGNRDVFSETPEIDVEELKRLVEERRLK